MQLPIDVFADLVVTHRGDAFTIQGEGKILSIAFPNAGIALRALRSFLASPLHSSKFLALLRTLDLTLYVLISERVVLKLGSGVKPNAISRLLGLPEGCISFRNLLLCMLPFVRK